MEIKEMEYTFKCSWFNRKSDAGYPCDGEHYVKIDINFYIMLFYSLIFHHGVSVDKEYVLKVIKDFEEYFNGMIIRYENGEDVGFNHFGKIDNEMEIISNFCFDMYGLSLIYKQ